ncbi:MAG: mycofactocin precursor MftA [Nocardiopsaceae bacterium]|jgi:mycofactocin precursor|nr:mycofactocin precursor MftA [Nocardiopsaceae bacterium]
MRRSDELDPVSAEPAAPPGATPEEPEELLVVDISFDGLCGVY